MRVTQFTLYNNFLINHQKELRDLTDTQTQIATGKKIQNMYDDPVIYSKYLKLNKEINSFTQIKDSANFALTFARETDTTINDIVSTLTSFKTKLLTAANDTNDETSREAIVSDLKGMLDHLKDLANTSIDGKYIFSGSAFDKKPIGDDFSYQGNDKYVKAFLGAGVEREYNIPGSEIFLGRDNDYKKHMTLNIPQFDKMKANPQFVVRGADGKLYIDKTNPNPDAPGAVPVNEPITIDSEIRMLTGVEDIDNGNGTYSDGTSYFYIKGRKPNGESINTKFSLSNSAKVNDLLEKIGEEFGNTASSKVVDVSLNDMGEIQIKDLNSGKLITDFFLVASDADRASVEDLVKNGDYIVEFQKSEFNSIRNIDTIKTSNKYFNDNIFKFGAEFKLLDGSRDALPQDKVVNVLGSEGIRTSDGSIQTLSNLHFEATDRNGNALPPVDLTITNNTTMQDILNAISSFGVKAELRDGEIIITDDPDNPKLGSLTITGEDSGGNNLEVFAAKDSVSFNKLYMQNSENLVLSNVSQVTKDTIVYYKDGQKIVTQNPLQEYATNNTVVLDTLGVDIPQDGVQVIKVNFYDKNNTLYTAEITLRDSPDANGHLSNFWIDKNRDGTKDPNEVFDIYNNFGEKTPAHTTITIKSELDPVTCELCTTEKKSLGVTFSQLGDVISMLVTGNIPNSNTPEDYQTALASAKKEVETGMDSKGRFYIKDLTTTSTNIKVSMYTDNNSISFMENNAITIDSPQTNFFDTLQKAIEAVENGKNFADASSNNPRNYGIQGALEAIEHVMDRVRRSHAKIGAVSNEFDMTIERVDMLKINVQTLQSENIDTDLGEASMRLNTLNVSYQALLASIAKVNNLTLLNYLR
ncbi:flagellar hook-associated protein FlgL [Caminibacter profundus]